MASRISSISLDDHAPYRRLEQFAVQAPPTVWQIVSPQRRILGLPARTPVLGRVPAASRDSQLDAA